MDKLTLVSAYEEIFIIFLKPDSEWLLTYDFTLQVCEGCYVNSIPQNETDIPIRSYVKCIGGEYGKGWEIMNMEEYASEDSLEPVLSFREIKWIRGLGSYNDWFTPNMSDWIGGPSCIVTEVSCQGEVIYANTSGIYQREMDESDICIVGREVVITGAVDGSHITVTDLSGRLIYDFLTNENNCSLTLPESGIYLIRVGDKIIRVMVR